MLPRDLEDGAMNTLVPLALVGFVLAIGLALPYRDDEDPVTNGEIQALSGSKISSVLL